MITKFTLVFFVFLSFSFCIVAQTGTVTDFDGNVYKTVKIGNQWWMAENLRTTHYYDGTAIPQSTATVTKSADDYKDYFMYPNNDVNNIPTYGLLYSWSVTTTKALLPSGWVLADTTAWAELAAYVGGKTIAGGKLKNISAVWTTPNTSATDDYGFNAVPAGDCNTGGFTVFGTQARYWTSQLVDAGQAGRIYMYLANNSAALTKGQYRNVNALSLRYVVKSSATEASSARDSQELLTTVEGENLVVKNISVNSKISIYNIAGKLIKTAIATSSGDCNVGLHGLSKGVYLLAITSSSTIYKQKFIKY